MSAGWETLTPRHSTQPPQTNHSPTPKSRGSGRDKPPPAAPPPLLPSRTAPAQGREGRSAAHCPRPHLRPQPISGRRFAVPAGNALSGRGKRRGGVTVPLRVEGGGGGKAGRNHASVAIAPAGPREGGRRRGQLEAAAFTWRGGGGGGGATASRGFAEAAGRREALRGGSRCRCSAYTAVPPPWAGQPRSPSPPSAWLASAGWPRGSTATTTPPLVSASRPLPPPHPTPTLSPPTVADGAAPPALAPRPLSGLEGERGGLRAPNPARRPTLRARRGRGAPRPRRARRVGRLAGEPPCSSFTARPPRRPQRLGRSPPSFSLAFPGLRLFLAFVFPFAVEVVRYPGGIRPVGPSHLSGTASDLLKRLRGREPYNVPRAPKSWGKKLFWKYFNVFWPHCVMALGAAVP